MRKEARERTVEQNRLLEIGQVSGFRNDDQIRTGNASMHLVRRGRRRHRILRADEDERRNAHGREERCRVRASHQGTDGAADGVRRARQDERAHPFHDVRPLRRLQTGVDLFIFNKFRKDAPIDETTRDQRFLGVEPDVYVNWEITSDVTLAVRYGIFFPSDRTIPIDDNRQFVFAGVTFAF